MLVLCSSVIYNYVCRLSGAQSFNTSIKANFAKHVIKDGYFVVGMFSNVP